MATSFICQMVFFLFFFLEQRDTFLKVIKPLFKPEKFTTFNEFSSIYTIIQFNFYNKLGDLVFIIPIL